MTAPVSAKQLITQAFTCPVTKENVHKHEAGKDVKNDSWKGVFWSFFLPQAKKSTETNGYFTGALHGSSRFGTTERTNHSRWTSLLAVPLVVSGFVINTPAHITRVVAGILFFVGSLLSACCSYRKYIRGTFEASIGSALATLRAPVRESYLLAKYLAGAILTPSLANAKESKWVRRMLGLTYVKADKVNRPLGDTTTPRAENNNGSDASGANPAASGSDAPAAAQAAANA